MDKTIYERIYEELDVLLGSLPSFIHGDVDYLRIERQALRPLHIERIAGGWIALAQKSVRGVDLIPDMEFEVLIHEGRRAAEVWAFQQEYSGIQEMAYPMPGYINHEAKNRLNALLLDWLFNLRAWGCFPANRQGDGRAEQPIA